MSTAAFPSPAIGLDALLSSVARGLVSAQQDLDRAALAAPEMTVALPDEEMRLQPLWFVFGQTVLELEFSTFVSEGDDDGAHFSCRPLQPINVGLYGRTASASTRLRVTIEPLGAELLRRTE